MSGTPLLLPQCPKLSTAWMMSFVLRMSDNTGHWRLYCTLVSKLQCDLRASYLWPHQLEGSCVDAPDSRHLQVSPSHRRAVINNQVSSRAKEKETKAISVNTTTGGILRREVSTRPKG